MDARQQLKIAILQHCADHGLTLEQTRAVVKRAADRLAAEPLSPRHQTFTVASVAENREKRANLGSVLGGARSLAKGVWDVGRTAATGAVIPAAKFLAVAAPLAAVGTGSLTGYTLARGGGISDEDIDEEKKRELVDAYRSAAERLRRAREMSSRRAATPVRAGRSIV